MGRSISGRNLCLIALSLIVLLIAGETRSAFAQSGQTFNLNIPSQELNAAVLKFAEETGVQVFYDFNKLNGISSGALAGEYTAKQALRILFAGTGLTARFTDSGVVRVDAEVISLQPIQVAGMREGGSLDTLSRNVTVIPKDEIMRQQETSHGLADMIAKLVPGMSPSSQTLSNFGQRLRGRDVLVLIDGVPLNTSRNVSRDLFNITPSNIESIEVVHGGSALYGDSAAGGIIHINTLKGETGEPVFKTTMAGSSGLSRVGHDALSGRMEQQVSGKENDVDYLLSFSGEQTQGFFDADADRIAPEPSQGDLSDTRTVDLLAKIGYEWSDQRVQFSASYLDSEQDTDFVSDPTVTNFAKGSVKSRPLSGLSLENQAGRENLILNLNYSNRELFGSSVKTQAYFRDYETRFSPFDGRTIGSVNAVIQTFLVSEVYGGRVTVDTPIIGLESINAKLLWGADVKSEDVKQPATVFNGTIFDSSGGTDFVVTNAEKTYVPKMTTNSYGVFAQLEANPVDWLTLRGGLRHEIVDVSYGAFTTLGAGNNIEGGEIDYAETTFNVGAVVTPVEDVDVYANFSQSFELPDIGLQLRLAGVGFSSDNASLNPRITDNVEIGIRRSWDRLRASIAGFYSESDEGNIFIENFTIAQARTTEKIYGVEATADYAFSDQLDMGGTFTWLEGIRANPSGGDDIALDGFRIPPLKLTGYMEYHPSDWWNLRLHALYSGNRTSAADDNISFGGREVSDYTVVDLYGGFDLGHGKLKVGVENLLNNQYKTVFGQLLRNSNNTSNITARGATARIAYTFNW
ncbi:MAG: TonB-dependent receptor [Candidatus Nitrohelix vancouverensis]|uniref:TonB-dependent receptor n=1 Tax=Candidatus Nitrohelix vancouverensis TaxID=2705534 RepID=A0A7T0G4F4_9BACT|nr:MAG: TonB-dependent receptor [Candidatus Nitrohelix vancouverensis]